MSPENTYSTLFGTAHAAWEQIGSGQADAGTCASIDTMFEWASENPDAVSTTFARVESAIESVNTALSEEDSTELLHTLQSLMLDPQDTLPSIEELQGSREENEQFIYHFLDVLTRRNGADSFINKIGASHLLEFLIMACYASAVKHVRHDAHLGKHGKFQSTIIHSLRQYMVPAGV